MCLKIAFRQLCVPLCGRFGPDEGGVAGYVDRIGTKYAAKWDVQMAGMNFQTRPKGRPLDPALQNRRKYHEINSLSGTIEVSYK